MRPPIFALSLCLAGLVILSTALSGPASISSASPDPGDVTALTVATNSRLGIDHISAVNSQVPTFSDRRYQRAADAGAKWNRWVFYWHEIESSNDNYNYSSQDAVATADYNRGIETLAVLMGSPGWCTTATMSALSNVAPAPRVGQKRYGSLGVKTATETFSGPSPAVYPPQNLYQPVFNGGDFNTTGGINKLNYWADFVYETVSRFKGRIKYWEIWNEPDYRPTASSNWFGFWNGTPQEYYRLLKVAYLAAKHADPQATIIMGGMAYWPDANPDSTYDFVPAVLDTARADSSAAARNYYFDVSAWHWYNRSSQMYDMVNQTRKYLTDRGMGNKPYWVNETGSPAWNDPAKPPFGGPNNKYFGSSTMTEQASYIIQAIAYGLAAGVDKILVFQLYDDGNPEAFGLLRGNDSERPQYYAFQQAATYFRDITSISRSSNGTAYVVTALTNTDGINRRITALWNNSPTATTVNIPAAASSALKLTQPTEADVNGSSQTITPSNGQYSIYLPGATCRLQDGSPDYIIGGLTYILVETISGSSPTPTPPPSSGTLLTGLIANGDFELTPLFTGWTTAGQIQPTISTNAYHGGKAVILGQGTVPAGGGSSAISQQVTLPSVPNLSLEYALDIDTSQSDFGDFFEVTVNDQSVFHTTSDCQWQKHSIDLSQWAGQTVTVRFSVWQSSAESPTTARVDLVSIWPYKTHLPYVSRNASS